MKSSLILSATSLLVAAVRGSVVEPVPRDTGGYVQNPFGTASFTNSSGCNPPACGIPCTGYTAAMSQLAFGSDTGLGAGGGCGRCFLLTAFRDPYSPKYEVPFNSIVVRVKDLCAAENNPVWCNQTPENPVNQFGQSVHFDLCPGAWEVFFPQGHYALTGMYVEVLCSEFWQGTEGKPLWDHACLADVNAPNWPANALGCPNQGTPP